MESLFSSEDTEKLLYLKHLQNLEDQLERFEPICDELEKVNEDLVSQCKAIEKEKRDTTDRLKRSLSAEERRADELEEELQELHQSTCQELESLRQQHQQELQELQEQILHLSSLRAEQAARAEVQDQQLAVLQQRSTEAEALRHQLTHHKELNQPAIDNLRRTREAQMELMVQMQEETGRLIQEEAGRLMKVELAQLSQLESGQQSLLSDRDELQGAIEELKGCQSSLSAQRDGLKARDHELDQKNLQLKAEERRLTEAHLHLRAELQARRHRTREQHLACRDGLRKTLAAVSKENREGPAELLQLQAELQTTAGRTRHLEGLKQEAAIILTHIRQRSEKTSHTHCLMMERLLHTIESSAPQGPGSTYQTSKPSRAGLKSARH